MEKTTNQEAIAKSVVEGMRSIEYSLECAADLALCLSIVQSTTDIPEEPMANALYALHEFLSGLHEQQEAVIHAAVSGGKNQAEGA